MSIRSGQGHRPSPLLLEMVRESERVLDQQLTVMQTLDGRSQELIRLAVAALAGGTALALYVVSRFPGGTDPEIVVGLLAAAGANLASLVLLAESYVGFGVPFAPRTGPDPGWVSAKARDLNWSAEDHMQHLLSALTGFHDHNAARIRLRAAWRRAALACLLAAVIGYGLAYAYILSRSMS